MTMVSNTKEKRSQWHPAFYGAMHLEFMDNKNDLEFTEEFILNTLPLRADLLIVKNNAPVSFTMKLEKYLKNTIYWNSSPPTHL